MQVDWDRQYSWMCIWKYFSNDLLTYDKFTRFIYVIGMIYIPLALSLVHGYYQRLNFPFKPKYCMYNSIAPEKLQTLFLKWIGYKE